MLQEINDYLRHFLWLELNSPFADGEIISILVAIIPSAWHRKTVSINFKPSPKSLTDVIEYLEHLERLEGRTQRTLHQKIRLRSHLSQRVRPRERTLRQNKLRKESRGLKSLNQIILRKKSVLIVRIPMVGTGLMTQKSAI